MKKKQLKKTIGLSAVALVLTAGLAVGTAMAYFTTYATAEGGYTLDLGFTQTIPNEDVVNGKKEITLENIGEFDCYVRLKALTGDAYKDDIRYSEPAGEGKWTPGADGYYYYSDIVAPGASSSQIDVSFVLSEENPVDFNVIIIQECTPVHYDEDGNPYADWSETADVSQSIYK